MRTTIKYYLISFFAVCIFFELSAQPQFALSTNVYRAPYTNGKTFTVTNDVFTHSPVGRYDLRAQGDDDCSSHQIVAAAEGVVRYVIENNTQSCSSGCGQFNNYVWLEHANGEWTKYTHFATNSVVVNVGDTIAAGTILGFECWVGSTSPPMFRHLHFEVRRPDDPIDPPIDTSGGFLNASDATHLVPVMCGIDNNFIMNDDEELTGDDCGTCILLGNLNLSNETYGNNAYRVRMTEGTISASTVVFNNGSSGLLQSGSSVTMTPGFRARPGSFVQVRTGPCQTTDLN